MKWLKFLRIPATPTADYKALLSRSLEREAALRAQLEQARKPFPVVDSNDPEWRQEDADRWRAWLASAPGQALLAKANFAEQACNRQAVLRTDAEENLFANNSGFARGWHNATEYFFKTLTADVRPEQDEATEHGDEASRLRERLAS